MGPPVFVPPPPLLCGDMKRRIILMALTTQCMYVSAADGGFSRLEAISLIETADNDRLIGSKGEISRYQIMPCVWRQYSQSRNYQDRKEAKRIAQQHLQVLEELFRRRTGRAPAEFDIYVMWNAGPYYYAKRGFSPGRVAPSIRERATRFVNLRTLDIELQAKAR